MVDVISQYGAANYWVASFRSFTFMVSMAKTIAGLGSDITHQQWAQWCWTGRCARGVFGFEKKTVLLCMIFLKKIIMVYILVYIHISYYIYMLYIR